MKDKQREWKRNRDDKESKKFIINIFTGIKKYCIHEVRRGPIKKRILRQ